MNKLAWSVLIVLIASVACIPGLEEGEGDKGKKGGWHKKHEKHMKCMNETKQLHECCPTPEFTELKEDSECKVHLEGIEEKEGKEKGKAYMCFLECMFKKNQLFVDDELKRDEIKNFNQNYLGSDPDFKDISETAIDYCLDKFEEKKEEWKKWKDMKPKHDDKKDSDDEKKCNMQPAGLVGCMMGYISRNCPESKWISSDTCNEIKESATSIDECMK